MDSFGRPVPSRLAEVFRRASKFRSLVHRIGVFKSDLSALKAEGDGTELLRVNAVSVDLVNAQKSIRFSTPHGVCPRCDGVGCYGEKPLCSGRGWLPEDVCERLSPELKAKLESFGGKKSDESVA
jgi:hypothetical protein